MRGARGAGATGRPEPRRLLCVKIASRGDLLLAGPTFRMLRLQHPDAEITLLVGRSSEDVGRRLPFFDSIRVIDDHALFGRRKVRGAWELFRAMRRWARGGGDAEALIFHRDWRYGMFAMLAGIPVRRGFSSERGTRFLTHPFTPGEGEHHARQYVGMACAGAEAERGGADARDPGGSTLRGVWSFASGERELGLRAAAELGFRSDAGPWVALVFGGGRNAKTVTTLKAWPVDRYEALAAALVERGHGVVWVGDREDARALNPDAPGLNLAGRLTVAESAAVLSACDAAVANDTLMMHMSEALGVPKVGLFGPTDPLEYRPLGERSSYLWRGGPLPCSPCHRDGYFPPCALEHRCMRDIEVGDVLDRVLSTLGSRRSVGTTAGHGA